MSSHPARDGSTSSALPPPVESALGRVVHAASTTSPVSGIWIPTTRDAALSASEGGWTDATDASSSSAAVYLVVLTGQFEYQGAHVPPGQPYPKGSVLIFTVAQDDGAILDLGVRDTYPNDLSTLSLVNSFSFAF